VPYQADLDTALQELRRQVFARGDYFKVWDESGPERRVALAAELAEMAEMMGASIDEGAIERLASGADPGSIDEALMWSMDSGTHSVLDVAVVQDEPAPGAVTPMGTVAMMDLFGTAEPTSTIIEGKLGAVCEGISDRWAAVAIVGYAGGAPESIFFVGVSGD
jgi:hypothetical protein